MLLLPLLLEVLVERKYWVIGSPSISNINHDFSQGWAPASDSAPASLADDEITVIVEAQSASLHQASCSNPNLHFGLLPQDITLFAEHSFVDREIESGEETETDFKL